MALVHADNFSIYGSTTSLLVNGVYAQADNLSLVVDPDGISSGRVVKMHVSAAAVPDLRYVLTSPTSVMGICVRIWLNKLPPSSNEEPVVMDWRNNANNVIASLRVNTTGRLVWSDGTTILTAAIPSVTANGWYHIEAKYDRSGVGSIEARVEGITVLSSVSLGYSSASQIYQVGANFFGTNFGSTDMYLKDYVLWDGSGSYNTNFLGSVLVHSLVTSGDTSLNWTPSTGTTGWEILSNIPPVDSEYISAPYDSGGPPFYPDPYQGSLTDLPVETTSVKGLITFVRAAKSDGGDGSLQVGIVSDPSGTPATALGADRPITVAQTYWRDVFEVDPVTSSPWLPDAVNDADIQINRTS